MALITTKMLNSYYSEYADQEVTFTRDVIKSLGVITKQVYVKYKGGQLPCIIYSSSMKVAKILINLDKEIIKLFKEQKNQLQVRFCFVNTERVSDPISFFVQAKIVGMTLFKKETGLFLINCEYSHRPPDSLIQILGTMIEASIVSKKRKDERVTINPESLRKLGFDSKNAERVIDNIPRNAIIRDVSFAGMKVIVLGNAKFLIGKSFILKINMKDGNVFEIPGKIVRFETVEGRKEICALALVFDEKSVPMEYTLNLNNYFKTVKSVNE